MANASVEAYKRRCAAIPPAVRRASFAALASGAQKMGNGMKAAVPRDKGSLANSLTLDLDEPALRATIRAGGEATTVPVRNGATAKYDYALAQEFGTEKMAANPFFWPTYRLFRKSLRASVKRAMRKAIKAHFPTEGGNV